MKRRRAASSSTNKQDVKLSDLLKEDIFDLLRQDMTHDDSLKTPGFDVQRLRLVNLVQDITTVTNHFYTNIARMLGPLDVVAEVIKDVEEQSNQAFPTDESVDVAKEFSHIAQEAVTEYKSKMRQQPSSTQPSTQPVNESLTLATVGSMVMNSSKGLPGLLDALRELANFYQLGVLHRGLRLGNLLLKKVEEKGSGSFSGVLTPETSYRLYRAMWNKGFQTSKILLGEQDYGDNKESAKTLVEGLMYKLVISWYALPGVLTLLKVSAALLKKAEINPEAEAALTKVQSSLKS